MTSADPPGTARPDGAPAAAPGPSRRWHPSPGPRVTSWLVDWLVIGGWLGVLTLVGYLTRGSWTDAGTTTPTVRALLVTDLFVTLGTVVPYVLYLALTEASGARATLGKRVGHLVVAGQDGGRPTVAGVWLRNLVKAAPWQLAHLGVSRTLLDVQQGWAPVLVVASLVLAAACAVPSLVGGRGLHDRVAGTRVERASAEPVAPGATGRTGR